ncbi:hypothetical protein Ct61P_02215 [Colletotrichum tofieldiae]|nr:hypothetical protein Ct61P_02215 [Colletotrichum tofieldiae]
MVQRCPLGVAATELREHLPCLIKNVALLLKCHVDWVLVAVAMQPNLVACITHHGTFFWKVSSE